MTASTAPMDSARCRTVSEVNHAQVNGQRYDVCAVLFLEPRHGYRGVQPAAVGENDSVVLAFGVIAPVVGIEYFYKAALNS